MGQAPPQRIPRQDVVVPDTLPQKLVFAASRGRMSILQDPQHSSDLYTARDSAGNNLLQVTIKYRKKQAFDYILSLADFPLEALNDRRETALVMALATSAEERGFIHRVKRYFAWELIKRGANVHALNSVGHSLLHKSIVYRAHKSALILMRRGVDVNARNSAGDTPLHLLVKSRYSGRSHEQATGLLYHGANPKTPDSQGREVFECALSSELVVRRLVELVYDYTFDELEQYDLRLECLLQLALIDSPVFERILQLDVEVVVDEDLFEDYFRDLFRIKEKYLRILIERFEDLVVEIIEEGSNEFIFAKAFPVRNSRLVANIDLLLDSTVGHFLVDFFNSLRCCTYYVTWSREVNESRAVEMLLNMLSYGVKVRPSDFLLAYNKFGYGELFKHLLMMDVNFNLSYDSFIVSILPVVISNVTLDIHEIMAKNAASTRVKIDDLFYYFAHPKVRAFMREKATKEPLLAKIDKLPRVPLLKEYARDAFRKFFVQRFGIKGPRQFYTLLKVLPIGRPIEEIITFDRMLYHV
ncbi:unnamed protein product [Tenebrio molitor]|nr:unnamed protein product [Tenebrio molitor]